jgi:competence protein ComEC
MLRSGSLFSVAPFLRLLFPLLLGVSVPFPGNLFSPATFYLIILIIILFLLWFREGSFYFQPVWTILLMFIVFCLGTIRVKQESLVFPVLQEDSYCVILDDYPREKEKTLQLTGRMINSSLKILVYLPKTAMASNAGPGSKLLFDGKPELIVNAGNPFEFDYQGYLKDKGIGYRIFLKEGKFSVSENREHLQIFHRALIFRRLLIERLGSYGIKPDNVRLIGSISFGARDDVDKETIRSFTNTGVIHVLAVSGMNVGLIYVVLDFIFRFLKSGRPGSVIHTFLMISGIWSYTIIAGMSASILRAAVMFSFVIIGTGLRRNSNIFNSLCVSSFILIVSDPAIIRDVGFQLSYAALLSIVVIQPILYRRLYFRNLLADKMWLLLSVTFAAQAGTLPFTLVYFHQFPVYFWLANLIVVPVVTIILYLSVALLFISLFSGFLASMAGLALNWSADLVILTVRLVDKLPYSVISGIYPTIFQMVLMVVAVFLFWQYHRHRKWLPMAGMLISAILLVISAGIGEYRQLSREEIVFFNIPQTRALALTNGRRTVVLYDSYNNSEEKLGYLMNPYFEGRGIREREFHRLNDSLKMASSCFSVAGNHICYNGFKIFVEPHQGPDTVKQQSSRPDLAWLRNDQEENSDLVYFKNCGIILYKSEFNPLQTIESLPGSKIFNMNRAVLLSFSSRIFDYPQKISCNYFDGND